MVGPRYDELSRDTRSEFLSEFQTLAERHNPIVRRVIRRTRPMLEERGLLKRIGVITHPRADDGLATSLFDGEGLVMNFAFKAAYEAAEKFSQLYAKRCPGAGFLKTILLRRIGSSAKAGLETARHLLGRLDGTADPGGRDRRRRSASRCRAARSGGNPASCARSNATSPLWSPERMAIRRCRWFCTICATGDGSTDNGAIIFSQYRTTAEWVLEALCAAFPDEPVALYAGGAASFVQRGQDRRTAAREQIKARIQNGEIRLVCATDAACEGLNLQRLGAQVNIDMPWNPSRLEQRKGRVQRIGQVRDDVHVLNLRYAGTVEDQVYATLSSRFGDIFSVLGQLPDSFEDDWIDAILKDRIGRAKLLAAGR